MNIDQCLHRFWLDVKQQKCVSRGGYLGIVLISVVSLYLSKDTPGTRHRNPFENWLSWQRRSLSETRSWVLDKLPFLERADRTNNAVLYNTVVPTAKATERHQKGKKDYSYAMRKEAGSVNLFACLTCFTSASPVYNRYKIRLLLQFRLMFLFNR